MSSDPRLEDVLLDVLDSRFQDVHTCMPGSVESYDSVRQTASVRLMVKRVDLDEANKQTVRSYPVLANVPICWPRFGGYFIHGPLVKGDFVMVHFAESAIAPWRTRGVESHPGDLRRHGLTGAMAVPCGYPQSRTIPADQTSSSDLVIGKEGGEEIRITSDGDVLLGEGADEPVAIASKVHAVISTMLGAGIGATGTQAFAAAKIAWDALPIVTSMDSDNTKAKG